MQLKFDAKVLLFLIYAIFFQQKCYLISFFREFAHFFDIKQQKNGPVKYNCPVKLLFFYFTLDTYLADFLLTPNTQYRTTGIRRISR